MRKSKEKVFFIDNYQIINQKHIPPSFSVLHMKDI